MRPGYASDMNFASRPGPRPGRAIHRVMSAWLAIFGLIVQLLAAGACPIALSSDQAFASPELAFPICHTVTASEEASGRADDPSPAAPPHDCPFCAAHGQAALADAPPARTAAPVATLVPAALPTPEPAPRRTSLCIAASPRGPPAAI